MLCLVGEKVWEKQSKLEYGFLFNWCTLTISNLYFLQSEDSLVDLLQNLADMDITFIALKVVTQTAFFIFLRVSRLTLSFFLYVFSQETDIGRHVNRLRKHPSNEVRRLVKQLVRFGERKERPT